MSISSPENILDFWFDEVTMEQKFQKDAEFDQMIASRFGATIEAVSACECAKWRLGSKNMPPAWGRLAEIIVLDQFRRNVFRDTPAAFSHDPLALALAQEMLARGDDTAVEAKRRNFVYLPFMHSESPAVQKQSLALYRAFEKVEPNAPLSYAIAHADIIERFGRYPHRNAILGRESTSEELEFLKQEGSSF